MAAEKTQVVRVYSPMANRIRIIAAIEGISAPALLERLLADRLPKDVELNMNGNIAKMNVLEKCEAA